MSDFIMYALAIAITSVIVFAMCNVIKPLYLDIKELLQHH